MPLLNRQRRPDAVLIIGTLTTIRGCSWPALPLGNDARIIGGDHFGAYVTGYDAAIST